MPYTYKSLEKAAVGISGQRRVVAESYAKSASAEKIWVFLSHSHYDKEKTNAVDNAKLMLGNEGIALYVDSDDTELPKTISPQTAVELKNKIGEYGKFILLATQYSLKSVWCGWELGVADSLIKRRNVLVWAINNDLDPSLAKNEYVGIYQRIEPCTDGKPGVFEPCETEGIHLSTWLSQ